MPNYYRDNSDLLFHMKTMDIKQVVELKEDDFKEHGTYPDAPKDSEDARDNYHRVLDIVGDIAGEFVAPRAADVDKNGAKHINGEVVFPKPILESLDRLRKADLMGMTLPRKYDGINLPMTVYMAAIEMISRADASLMLLFGLQGIGETISRFGSEDQKQRYLPRFCAGEVMGAMALTEPDAGSDLQAVSLQADLRPDGKWVLNGVKRFITNG
ncbi:MAG: acyl-CoA dehydrogenase family protein, partial [Desulfobacterales bacterium]